MASPTTTIRGRVETIGPITQVGEKKTDLQYMILFVPGYDDGFGNKGRDSLFCLQAMGKKVTELAMTEALDTKIVDVKCYLDGQFIKGKETGQDGFYTVNLTIKEFSIVK